jgi:excisionase family DNA binding protein
MAKIDNPSLLSVGDAATYLKVSHSLIYKYVEQMKIPHIRIGGRIRFDQSALAEWINSRSYKAVSHD